MVIAVSECGKEFVLWMPQDLFPADRNYSALSQLETGTQGNDTDLSSVWSSFSEGGDVYACDAGRA